MNILIAPDKFKGSLTAQEAAQAMAAGVEEAYGLNKFPCDTAFKIKMLPMADGGDGSLAVVEQQFKGDRVRCKVHDPLGREILAEYLLNGSEAFIEMAAISGLELLKKGERNPLRTSTYGLGEAIKDACSKGARNISLSIGGSATNDCGAGMLQALGMTVVLDETAEQQAGNTTGIIAGGDLYNIKSVDLTPVERFVKDNSVKFKVICDVENPLLGFNGATYVYSPQKGADKKIMEFLENGMKNFAELTTSCHNMGCSFAGAGAAGGAGYAMHALLGAELVKGSLFFAELNHLDETVEWADAVITGEGCLDEQSFNGKVVGAIYDSCRRHKKRLYILCGISKLQNLPDNISVCSLVSVSKGNRDSFVRAYEYLKEVTYNIFQALQP